MAVQTKLHADGSVFSEQTLPAGGCRSARELAERYVAWLPGAFFGLIRTRQPEGRIQISLIGLPLLVMESRNSTPERATFSIVGGALARDAAGVMVFERNPDADDFRAVVDGYRPRLPPWLYRLTQRPLHDWVMGRFARALARESHPGPLA